jgi:hypothetical protein
MWYTLNIKRKELAVENWARAVSSLEEWRKVDEDNRCWRIYSPAGDFGFSPCSHHYTVQLQVLETKRFLFYEQSGPDLAEVVWKILREWRWGE